MVEPTFDIWKAVLSVVLPVIWVLLFIFWVRPNYKKAQGDTKGVWNSIILVWGATFVSILLLSTTYDYAVSTSTLAEKTAQMADDYNAALAIQSRDSNNLATQVNLLKKQFEIENRPWLIFSKTEYFFRGPSGEQLRVTTFPGGEINSETNGELSKDCYPNFKVKLFEISVYFENVGKTPAQVVFSDWNISADPFPIEYLHEPQTEDKNKLRYIISGEELIFKRFSGPFADEGYVFFPPVVVTLETELKYEAVSTDELTAITKSESNMHFKHNEQLDKIECLFNMENQYVID